METLTNSVLDQPLSYLLLGSLSSALNSVAIVWLLHKQVEELVVTLGASQDLEQFLHRLRLRIARGL